jgi:hypothetical protein
VKSDTTTVWRRIRPAALLLVLSMALILSSLDFARAHFLLNINVRVIQVEHLQDGLSSPLTKSALDVRGLV